MTDVGERIRIIVFDDNRDRRESLQYLIGMQEDMEFVAAFENADQVVEKVRELKPNIVLMDIEMPGINGIQAVRIIKEALPKTIILMQTVFDEERIIFDAIKAGASGYLIKKSAPQKIVEGIRDAYEGGAPISPAIASKVLRVFQTAEVPKAKQDYLLTPKEKEILALLVDGNSYKMVAGEMNISYHTVNTHIRHIYEKLHVHSVGEAVAKATKEGLI
jgi:DNA-binding NarL/FixJ family response regulator